MKRVYIEVDGNRYKTNAVFVTEYNQHLKLKFDIANCPNCGVNELWVHATRYESTALNDLMDAVGNFLDTKFAEMLPQSATGAMCKALAKAIEERDRCDAEARVWCKHDPTRKCVDCEGCPDESEVRDE